MLGNLSPKTKAQYEAFEELGLMAFDTAKGMQFLKDNGVKPASDSMEDVSNAIKKYIQESMGAKKWNADCEKSFQGLGLSAGFMNNAFYDTNGNIEDMATISEQLKKSLTGLTSEQRQQYLYTLFGSDAIRAGNILYKEGADGINNFKKAMGNVSAEEVATEKLNNLKGEIEQLKGSFETMAITAGKAIEPVVRVGVSGLQKIVDGFNNMPKGLQKFIVYGALAAGALAGIAAAGIAVVGAIGGIGIGIGGLAIAGEVIVALGAAALPVIGTVGLVVAGILAFGAAAVLLYKHWDKVQGFLNKNPFVKFLAHMNPVSGALLGIVGTVKKVQGVFDKTGLSSGLMSDKISDSTKKSIKSYTDLEQKATNSYINMNAKGTALTQKFVDSQAQLHGQMSKKIQDAIDKDYNKRIEKAKALFAKNDGLSKEEEARVLQRMKNDQQNNKDRVKAYEKQIHEIEQKASDERRKLTESEKRTISGIKNNMRVEAVKAMSKSEKEQMIILGRLKNDASKMSAQQAANVVKSSVKQRDETIKNANKQYTKTVREIEMMRDVTGDITAEDAEDMIAKAKKKKDESIKHATEMNEKVVAEAKKQAEGHASEVDWESGEVLSKWDKMTDRVGDLMDWIKGLFGKDNKSKTKNSKPAAKDTGKRSGGTVRGKSVDSQLALGTPYGGTPNDGYALTGEEGAELVKDGRTGGMFLTGVGGAEVRYLSKGSSVLPAHMTSAVLQKYGFGSSMPAYAEGIGIGNFDTIMKGADGIWDMAKSKFDLSDNILPKWFTDKSGSALDYIGGMAKDKIKGWVDEFMASFGGDGEGGVFGSSGMFKSVGRIDGKGVLWNRLSNSWISGATNIHPVLMERLVKMAQAKNKKMQITDGGRSYSQQVDLKRRKPYLAATPGKSRHEVGLAVDVASDWVRQMTNGQLAPFGLWKSALSKGETWHLEVAESKGKANMDIIKLLGGLNPKAMAASGGGGSLGSAPSGNLAKWISAGMARAGVSGDAWRTGLNYIAMKESTGRPHVVGAPTSDGTAKGLMQLKHFNYKGDPFDPVNNMYWGIKYIQGRYKTIQRAVDWWKSHHWYKNGTDFHKGGLSVLGDGGQYEPFMLPNGRMGLSPDVPTMFPDLPVGTKVWSSIANFQSEASKTLSSFNGGGSGSVKNEYNINVNYQGNGSKEDVKGFAKLIKQEIEKENIKQLRAEGVLY